MVDIRPRGDGTSSSENFGLSVSPERLQTISAASHSYHPKAAMSVSPMNMAKYSSPKGIKRTCSVTSSPATNGFAVTRHRRNISNVSNGSFVSYASSTATYGGESKTYTVTTLPFTTNSSEELKDVIVLADKAPKMLYCQLCGSVFREPYICTCGHTFCQSCVMSHKYETCPVDNTQLALVVANIAVADQVGELKAHCRYGCQAKTDGSEGYEVDPNGCPVIVKMSLRQEHELECDYAPSRCPNSSLCAAMMKKDLPEHLRRCNHVRCPYAKYNCPFEGTKEELALHLEKCRYEGLKEYLQKTDEHVGSLQQDLRQKEEEIEFLRSMLARLSEKLETLDKTTNLRLESLEEQQAQSQEQLGEAHQGIHFAIDEIHHVQDQLGVTGTMDSQHLYKCKGTFVGHEGPVWALCVQGETVCTGSSDNTLKIWNTGDQFKCLRTLSGHDGIVLVLCIIRERLYSGSEDKTIRVWHLGTGEALDRIEADENPISSLAHYGDMLFSGSLKTIKVWDTQTHALMKVLPEQNHWVRALAVQGKCLYSGAYKSIKVWNLESLECVREVPCPGGSIYSLVLNNKYLACGTYEHSISVWDLGSWEPLGTLDGHRGTVYDLTLLETPGQTKIFSASYDKTIRVWNVEHMRCVQTLTRHEGSVVCLGISRGRLFSGSVDGTVKFWH